MAKPSDQKKIKKSVAPPHGRAYIQATFNNTVITITGAEGEVVTWGSAGTAGFKGTRKSTPFAATTSVKVIAEDVVGRGMKSLDVFIKGPGMGRDAAVRALKAAGLQIRSISDITPIPHNGCRPRKRRKV
jgi:small subunit ribosomal protein S11